MSTRSNAPDREEIARIAGAIWEAEGRPEGRDNEHWMLAKQMIEKGRAAAEHPGAARSGGLPEKAAEDAAGTS